MCVCDVKLLFFLCALLINNGSPLEIKYQRSKRAFQNVVFDHSDRGGRKCHDFCTMIPELCRNGGTCVTDEITCLGRCLCTSGWTGQWCRDRLVLSEVEEELPKHGDFANELNNRAAADSDAPSLAEKLRNGILKELRGSFFTQQPAPTTTNPVNTLSTSNKNVLNETWDKIDDKSLREICEKDCDNGECIKINGLYKCKERINATDTSIPKVCGPGFVCDHGVCDLEALQKNSYNCKCEPNYVGQFCTRKCPFDCGEHGYCDIHVADNTYKCFCQWNYTGLNCSELVPEKPGPPLPEEVLFHWYVVGVSVAMVIVAVSTVFVAAYFMWRRRLVFMLKIVHYFQNYEDDDGKEYDAFVSYKSCPRDEEFVLHQLYPKLEREHNFKLCLHFRDFIPGEAIANNIVRAIESSRRTIMILSPEYVQSEWCRMEYQKAQHEMLKLKHKIIPIVLEDITKFKDVDTNLKSIISSVTYLEWPGHDNSKKTERFWKKLELSLPKKSAPSSSQDSTPESSSFQTVSEIDTSSSELVTSLSLSPPVSSIASPRLATDSPTLSSITSDSDSSKTPRKRKDFKHFMDKLVQSKLFGRQDSNSSQAALVDDETLASRSSCGSVSDSMLSVSMESICSTPDASRSFLNEIYETHEPETFLPSCASESDLRTVQQRSFHRHSVKYASIHKRVRGKSRKKRKETTRNSECEKDHCDDSECSTCVELNGKKLEGQETSSQEFINKGFLGDGEESHFCENCTYMRLKSDNNRIRISALDGSEQVKIQRLPRDYMPCSYCDHVTEYENVFRRSADYRRSVKEHKDATNLEIVMKQKQKRIASLPRNYERSRIFVTSEISDADNSCARTGSNLQERNTSCFIDLCENV